MEIGYLTLVVFGIFMLILGLETSCDETAAAIIEATDIQTPVTVLSSVLATSLALHAQTGGIIPEIAAREQVKVIMPIIKHALTDAKKTQSEIDAIAVTNGPGLIGSLLVGVETAKTLAYAWNKPIIPVNHLFGHIYANWIQPHPNPLRKGEGTKVEFPLPGERIKVRGKSSSRNVKLKPTLPSFPVLALIVSGGHTDLVLIRNHHDIEWLGGTRDDAAGEAFDKIGRALNFPYPAGPAFEQAAVQGDPKRFQFPRPLKYDHTYDFSFSGLKTAAIRVVQKMQSSVSNSLSSQERGKGEVTEIHEKHDSQKIKSLDAQTVSDITRCVQDAIIDVLIYKTMKAAEAYKVQSILLGGGVAANQALQTSLEQYTLTHLPYVNVYVPQKHFCTDNAAMIASAGYFIGKETPWQDITANPELYFD